MSTREEWINQRLSTLFSPLSEVPDEEKRYLFKPWFPMGKVTLLSGDPGVGKSKATLAIAALVTKGLPLFDVPCGKAGNVLLFSSEDDASDIKRTIVACGGDADKVFVLGETEESLSIQNKEAITFQSDTLKQAIAHFAPVLVVLDPLQRYVGRVDTNKAPETNQAFKALDLLGKKHGCSFVIVGHNAKGNYSTLAHKSLGSIDIIGNARSALSIVRDPENPNQCLMIHSKSNNVFGKTIRYEIQSIENDADFATVKWIGQEDYSERDYWKAFRRRDERELSPQISDDDAIVQTVLNLIRDNPAGVRLRKPDFWTAVEMYTGAAVSDGIDAIVKKYRQHLGNNHNIFVGGKPASTLKPFRVKGETVLPTKSPDRCLEIYKKVVPLRV